MNLRDAILSLDSASDDLCIVAKRPWNEDADCKLIEFTDDLRVPEDVTAHGFEYFLEVSVAKDEVLTHTRGLLTPDQTVAAVIYYADFDAYPEWLNEICRENSQ